MKDIIQIKGEMTAEQHKSLMASIKKYGEGKIIYIDNGKPVGARVIVVNETKLQVGFAEPTCNVETKRASKSKRKVR